jgi:hypothetical protein
LLAFVVIFCQIKMLGQLPLTLKPKANMTLRVFFGVIRMLDCEVALMPRQLRMAASNVWNADLSQTP